MQSNRGELQRIRAKIGELARKIGSLTGLLVDPDIDAMAKRAVSRQVGELADDANDNTARLRPTCDLWPRDHTRLLSPHVRCFPSWLEFRDANADHLGDVIWQSSTMNADGTDGLVELAEEGRCPTRLMTPFACPENATYSLVDYCPAAGHNHI